LCSLSPLCPPPGTGIWSGNGGDAEEWVEAAELDADGRRFGDWQNQFPLVGVRASSSGSTTTPLLRELQLGARTPTA
jgi:hypothetical protein